MQREAANLRFAMAPRTPRHEEIMRGVLARFSVDVISLEGRLYELMKHADLALVTSGSTTLELAWFGTPMVILYRLNRLSHMISRLGMRTKHIGLVNVLAGREIVPDLLLNADRPELVSRKALRILEDPRHYEATVQALHEVCESLESGGAAARAARAILEMAREVRGWR